MAQSLRAFRHSSRRGIYLALGVSLLTVAAPAAASTGFGPGQSTSAPPPTDPNCPPPFNEQQGHGIVSDLLGFDDKAEEARVEETFSLETFERWILSLLGLP